MKYLNARLPGIWQIAGSVCGAFLGLCLAWGASAQVDVAECVQECEALKNLPHKCEPIELGAGTGGMWPIGNYRSPGARKENGLQGFLPAYMSKEACESDQKQRSSLNRWCRSQSPIQECCSARIECKPRDAGREFLEFPGVPYSFDVAVAINTLWEPSAIVEVGFLNDCDPNSEQFYVDPQSCCDNYCKRCDDPNYTYSSLDECDQSPFCPDTWECVAREDRSGNQCYACQDPCPGQNNYTKEECSTECDDTDGVCLPQPGQTKCFQCVGRTTVGPPPPPEPPGGILPVPPRPPGGLSPFPTLPGPPRGGGLNTPNGEVCLSEELNRGINITSCVAIDGDDSLVECTFEDGSVVTAKSGC